MTSTNTDDNPENSSSVMSQEGGALDVHLVLFLEGPTPGDPATAPFGPSEEVLRARQSILGHSTDPLPPGFDEPGRNCAATETAILTIPMRAAPPLRSQALPSGEM